MRTSLTLSALLVALLLGACGTLPEETAAGAPTAGGAPCGAIEEPPLQAGSHVIGDAEPPVPYSSTPPTSGWHSSGALEVTAHGHDDPLSEAEQVSVLEADGAVVSYRDIPEADVAALAEVIEADYAGRVALTPYGELEPGQIALTAWGTLQRCAALDLDVVRAFLDRTVGEEVEPGH